jgi:hypothetical protein
MSITSAQAMINKVDKDGNGTLGFDEFVYVMTNGDVDPNAHAKLVESRMTPKEAMRAEAKAARSAEDKAELEASLIHMLRRAWDLEHEEHHDLWADESLHPVRNDIKNCFVILYFILRIDDFA